MWERFVISIGVALDRLAEAFLAIIPALLVLVLAGLVGVLAGLVLRGLFRVLLKILKLGDTSAASASSRFLKGAGVRTPPTELAAAISFWLAIVVALAVGVNALQPGALRNVLEDAVAFLPKLLTAGLLLVLGLGLAALTRRSLLLAGVNAGLPWARPAARFASAVVIAFFVAVALDHLGVGRGILVATFSIAFGGLVFAAALAFGLGARDLARRYLEKRLREEEEDSGIRHV